MSEARWEVEYTQHVPGINSTVTQDSDPAYALLADPDIYSTPVIYRADCYICVDPEFAAMGLPLCNPCEVCKGHVPADDVCCDDCGADQQELYYARLEAECVANGGHQVEYVPPRLSEYTYIEKPGIGLMGFGGAPYTELGYEKCIRCGIVKVSYTKG